MHDSRMPPPLFVKEKNDKGQCRYDGNAVGQALQEGWLVPDDDGAAGHSGRNVDRKQFVGAAPDLQKTA